MGFCNTYIPQSPRWPHEQQDFKNHCSSRWVTPPQQELSEHQPYQLHTNLDNAWKRDTAAACAGVATVGTSAHSRRKKAGASHPRGLLHPAGLSMNLVHTHDEFRVFFSLKPATSLQLIFKNCLPCGSNCSIWVSSNQGHYFFFYKGFFIA